MRSLTGDVNFAFAVSDVFAVVKAPSSSVCNAFGVSPANRGDVSLLRHARKFERSLNSLKKSTFLALLNVLNPFIQYLNAL